MADDIIDEATFLIIGGGIAGVSCAEMLSYLCPDEKTVLLTASPVVKAVTNISQLTKLLSTFDIEEQANNEFEKKHTNVSVITEVVTTIDHERRLVECGASGKKYRYQKLCICTGARPKLIDSANPYVIGIRDTESVQEFQERLKEAKKIVIVGNGGIATEMVYELSNIDITWVIKDESIAATFVDAGAGTFLIDNLNKEKDTSSSDVPPTKRLKYTSRPFSSKGDLKQKEVKGGALGPDWHSGLDVIGQSEGPKNVQVEYKSEIKRIIPKTEVKSNDENWNIFVELTNGNIIGCDFVVSATGVTPNGDKLNGDTIFELSDDGAIKVDDNLRTNISDIYAAGDVCHANWDKSKHWFQMRLWTQARQMGLFAGQCMNAAFRNEEITLDFSFEMFTHVTKFFGHKVILLGLFNGQSLNEEYEILLRMTKGVEYVKTVMKDGRMQGAVLIGETDLEETFENLILNQMDLSSYGEDLLDPNIDIEDYFD